MKNNYKFIILLFLTVAIGLPLSAQQQEIIIGTADQNHFTLPFYVIEKYTRVESIYPQSAFDGSCMINTIAFNSSRGLQLVFDNLLIYMGERATSTFSSLDDWTSPDDLQLVYSGNNVALGASIGWNEIVLDTPFPYEHTTDLVVVVASNIGTGNLWSWWWMSSVDQENVSLVWHHNTDPSYMEHPSNNTLAQVLYTRRAQIKLNVSPLDISCYKPQSIQVVNRTQSSIAVEWTPCEGSDSWDVYISNEEGSSQPIMGLTNPSYSFTGLNSNTTYQCHVRTRCGFDDVSSWRTVTTYTLPDLIGDGTEDSPYLLYSVNEIDELRQAMAVDWDTYGKHFRVMRDIATVTEPIRGIFRGHFDGNGHTINVNMDTQTGSHQALFESIGPGAYIEKLTVEGTIVPSSLRDLCTAGIVADNSMSHFTEGDDAYIVDCVNKVDFPSTETTSTYIGGIIGRSYGSTNANGPHLYIIRCQNKGHIQSIANYHGGIAGRFGNYGTIDGCVNLADIYAHSRCGGLVGSCENHSVIKNSFNKGNIIGNMITSNHIGGLVGVIASHSQVINSYNLGRVEMEGGDGELYVGGIVGRMNTGSVVRNVYNVGTVYNGNMTAGAIVDFVEDAQCVVDGAYYHENTWPVGISFQWNGGPTNTINDCSSFMQDTLNPLVCTLDTMCYGSTDLRTALNNWREGNPDYREWLEDVYGYNGYFPTFDAGRPPGLEITPDPLSLGHRPIGARVRSEELRLGNTGTTGLDITAVEIANASFVVLDETVWNPEMPIQLGGGQSLRVGVTTDPEAMVGEGTLESPLVVVWDGRSATMATVTATAYVPETPDVVETALEVDSFPFTTVQVTSDIYDNYNLPGAHVDGPDAVYKLTFDREMVLNAAMATGSQPKLALYREDFGGKGYPDVDNAYTGPAIGPGNVGPITEWLHYDDGEYVTTIGSQSGQLHWGIQFPASTLAAYEGCWLSKVMIYNADQSGMVNLMLYTGGVTSPGTLVATQEVTFTGSNRWEEVELETPMPLDVSRNLWICCSSETPYIASACDYVGEPNSCWISSDGSSNNWTILTQHGLPYSWMIRGLVTNQMMEEERMMRSTEGMLSDITVTPGIYYLVVSCTAAEYDLEINPTEIPLPRAANVIAPVDGAMNVSVPTTLRWNLGAYTTEYQLLFGTSYPPTEVVVDWTPDLAESYRTGTLQNNTQYFWRLNVRNSNGVVEGPVWGFTTTLDVPRRLVAENDKLYFGETLELSWNPPTDNRGLCGYHLYQDYMRVNTAPITSTSFDIEGLEYNMAGYRYHVTAVYDEGESNYSNTAFVRVSGNGSIGGHVYEHDGATGIAGALVLFYGQDEHGRTQSVEFVTDNQGAYGGVLPAGQYYAVAYKEDYENGYHQEIIELDFSEDITGIDFIMEEIYHTVQSVLSEEINDTKVKVQWNPPCSNERSLHHYKVYRTDCHTENYSSENTQLVASGLTDTFYMDQDWGTMGAGVYKWGVSCVYEGNRSLNNSFNKRNDGKKAYSCCMYGGDIPLGWNSYYTNHPTSTTSLNPDLRIDGGDYCGNGYVYAFSERNDSCFFHQIDVLTGEIISSVPTERTMQDCAYDISTGKLYGTYQGGLYIIDIEEGSSSLVSSLGVERMVMLACDASGQLYGIDYGDYFNNSKLYSINKFTGETQEIGPTGLMGRYYQSGGFDHQTGQLYWAGYSQNAGFFATVDITTGWATVLAYNTGEQLSWCIPFDLSYDFQEPGESLIVWSNRLDKDMTTNMEVSVALGSGEDPSGTRVRLINLSEPDMGFDKDALLDETGHCHWGDFRKGTYSLRITRSGFNPVRIDSLSIWETSSLDFILEEIIYSVDHLHVSTTGWAHWNERAIVSEWLYYDDGTFVDAIGTNGSVIYWGIMIPSSDLADFNGCALSEVRFFAVESGNYELRVYQGGETSPSELVYSETTTSNGSHNWHQMSLREPVDLDVTRNLWITFYCSNLAFPASASQNTGDSNGRWVSTDGVNWSDITTYGFDLTWMIRGLVSDEGRGRRSLQHFKVMLDGVLRDDVEEPYYQHEVEWMVEGSTHTTSVAAVYSTGFSDWVEYEWTYSPCEQYEGVEDLGMEFTDVVRIQWTEVAGPGVLGAMVFRDGTLLTPEPLTWGYYVDANPPEGVHTYCVRVVRGEEAQGVEDPVWYAMSCAECAMVDVTGVGTHEAGQVRVYPNPSLGELTLEAEGIRRVEVSNTLGQRVYDRELRCDHHRMDMSGLKPGVYTVRVTSAIGTTTHRVVLMR